MLNNNGIESQDIWEEVSCFFVKEKNMNLQSFYNESKFGLLIDLRSRAGQAMDGSSKRLVNTIDCIQLEIEWNDKGSGNVNFQRAHRGAF